MKITSPLALLAMLSLHGCATAPGKPLLPEALSDKHGVAIVRVMSNLSSIDRGNFIYANQWLGLKVIDASDKIFELKALKLGGVSSSQILAAELPAGQYRLVNMNTQLIGESTVALDSAHEGFEVQPSTLTALGTVIVQPTGNHQLTVLRDLDNQGLKSLLDLGAPGIAKSLDSKTILTSSLATTESNASLSKGGVRVISNSATMAVTGTLTFGIINSLIDQASATKAIAAWKTEKDPVKRLAMAKDSTYALNSPAMLPTGELLAGSNLGQVLVRTPSGTWGRLDTGTLGEITAISALSRQNVIIGGEEGYSAESKDGGITWRRLPSLPATAVVVNLQRVDNITLALVLESKDAVVYQLSTPEATTWTELKREPQASGTATGVASPQSLIGAARAGQRYQFATAGGAAHVMDLSTQQWSVGKAPSAGATIYRPMNFLRSNQEGVLFSEHFRKVATSMDFGATWQEQSHACSRIMDTVMTTDSMLYSLCTEGAFVVGTEIYAKPVGAGSWKNQGTTPMPINSWFVSPDGKLIVGTGPEGQLFTSKDSGKSWMQEYRQ